MISSREINEYVMLREAIKKKDKEVTRNLILNNYTVNIPNSRGASPLHWAIIKFDDLEIITMLLNKGADIHGKNHNNENPLEVAIQNNKTEAALLLIKKGALVGENLNVLLIKVIEKNDHTMFKIIIDHRTQDNRDINFKTLFDAALSRGHVKILEHILPYCQFLEPTDKYISKELVMKPGSQYKDCVELLFKWNFTIGFPNSNDDKDFVYAAVENGHLQIVLQLLKLGIDVNLINSNTGLSLLKIACLNKHHEIVENLLHHNAFLNITTPTNIKALNKCYDYNDSLSSICNKNDLWGLTCLHIAVKNSDPIMTRLLLKYGVKIIDDPEFFNITCMAVRNSCEEIVRIFLDHDVNVNGINSEGKSLLHFCVYCGSQDSRYNIAKLLLERGTTIQIQTPGNSYIFEAVKSRHRKIAELFLDNNADIQYISPDGNTLLHKAIEKNFDIKFIKTLLKLNSSVHAMNNKMYTPLLVACKTKSNNQFQIIKALLDCHANVNCVVNIPKRPQSLVDIILSLKPEVNLNATKEKGQTPLHFACKNKSDLTASIIKLLLERGANIEAVDARGWTPLFEACYSNSDVAVKCLLDHNAKANRTDLENLTPIYIAAQQYNSNPKVVKLLLGYKVNVHCIDKQRNSIVHRIVENRNAELIKSFARTQVNFNAVNEEGNTPLHIAVKKKFVDVVKSLIKYGANINVLDKINRTPLRIAINQIIIIQRKLQNYRNNRHSYPNSSVNAFNNNVYNADCYLKDTRTCKEIITILKAQVVKLKIAGLTVNNKNLNIVYNPDNYGNYEISNLQGMDYKTYLLKLEVECEQEIEKLRFESIGVKNMTFYDLLKKNMHILRRYVKNKLIQKTLKLEVYDGKFPLYIDIVRSRFCDAKLLYRLMNSAKNYFSLNIFPRLSDDCIDAVFSYLNIREIEMFITAMKPMNK